MFIKKIFLEALFPKRGDDLWGGETPPPSAKSGVFFAPGLSCHSLLATADGRKKLIKLSPPNGNIAFYSMRNDQLQSFVKVSQRVFMETFGPVGITSLWKSFNRGADFSSGMICAQSTEPSPGLMCWSLAPLLSCKWQLTMCGSIFSRMQSSHAGVFSPQALIGDDSAKFLPFFIRLACPES